MPSHLILVLGGVRSGKSSYAERLASHYAAAEPVLYLATAEAIDGEMADRIAAHRADRPSHWLTIEAPLDVAGAIDPVPATPVVLLDCLTVLTSNWLLAAHPELLVAEPGRSPELPVSSIDPEAEVQGQLDRLLAEFRDRCLIVVSNEVGMGIVPPYPLGRQYRDMLGRLNQGLARRADFVYLMVAGLPIEISALADRRFLPQD
jgi:adenosylcobinamide kinase / adenosylcobinamide-phosphate guanylyltransferase